VLDGDTESSLAARILVQEHKIYPQAVRWFAEDKLTLADGCVRLAAGQADSAALLSPEVPKSL
jgi:phosphoribosylglycinamide formyltransferase-1